jgi:lysozyme family protein
MSNFADALKKTLKNEGGYSNKNTDRGGETFAGISRNNFPKWSGWKIIDKYSEQKDKPRELSAILFKIPELNELIQEFYEHTFWEPIHGYEIISQIIANKLFDLSVNMWITSAVKCLQKALLMEEIDGIIGKETLAKVNGYVTSEAINELLLKFCYQAESYYQAIVKNNQSQKVNLKGWLSRLYEK